jgi:hypothetical protein
VASKKNRGDDDSPYTRPPGRAAVVLLGIYISMYMAAAGIVRVLTVHEATAAYAQDGSTAHPLHADLLASPAGRVESPRSDAPAPASERMNGARECDRAAVIDSTCLSN